MRRPIFVTVLLMIALSACGDRSRPEGTVERWLLALNQGAAGEPGRFASDQTSDQVLPHRGSMEPGRLDVIEVGAAERTRCSFDVPFRVVDLDGHETRMFAILQRCPTAFPKPIAAVERRDVPHGVFPSEGGSSFGTDRAVVWALAAAIGLGILFLGEGLMRLTRRTVISRHASGVGSPRGGDDA